MRHLVFIASFFICSQATCQVTEIIYGDTAYMNEVRYSYNGLNPNPNSEPDTFYIKDNLTDGTYIVYANAEKSRELIRGVIVNQQRTGKWEYYYRGGQKGQMTIYVDGHIISDSIWHKSGQIVTSENFDKKFRRHGVHKYWHHNGQFMSQTEYKHGVPKGTSLGYWSDGAKHTETVYGKRGDKIKITSWHSNDIVADILFLTGSMEHIKLNGWGDTTVHYSVIDGNVVGVWNRFSSKQTISSTRNFPNKAEDGASALGSGEGIPYSKILEPLDRRFEDRERIYVEYLKDNALATGTVSFFYPDGVKREERSYINGIIHGTWFLWHLNGQIAKETEFNKGQETGITRIYNEVGLLKEERYFSPDSVVKVRTWYDTGILKQEQEFYSSTSYVVIGNPGYGRGYHGIYDTEHYHVKERQFERVSLNRTKWHRNGVKASELIEDASGNISRTWDKYGKLTYDSSQRR